MSDRFQWDDTNSSGIWWSTNISIRDECILLKEDTECDDSDISSPVSYLLVDSIKKFHHGRGFASQ